MALYLVVAHQTAPSRELLETIQEVTAHEPDAEFVLLVPATPVSHLLTWTEGESLDVARETAVEAARMLRTAQVKLIDTVVGAPDPLAAVEDELKARGGDYAAVIISTLPLGVSRWLKRDLPTRVRSKLGMEVIHVISPVPAMKRAVA